VSLVAVAAALLGGGVAIVVKKLSSTETTTTIVMWFAIGGTIISFIPMLFVWSPPTLEQWGLLVLIGVFGVAGQATLTRAFSTGETSFVAPFDYTRLVIATLM
ncbi:MAG: EamA family transporter, partial [Deltaproteobacteria bacterium]|nr:EamA family transporter [Deltaproteobacteria bacterium]